MINHHFHQLHPPTVLLMTNPTNKHRRRTTFPPLPRPTTATIRPAFLTGKMRTTSQRHRNISRNVLQLTAPRMSTSGVDLRNELKVSRNPEVGCTKIKSHHKSAAHLKLSMEKQPQIRISETGKPLMTNMGKPSGVASPKKVGGPNHVFFAGEQ